MRHESPAALSARAERRSRRRWPRLLPLRIRHSILLVGAIPIAIATALAIASFGLLKGADDAHDGALRVATIYRQIVSAMSARDAYLASGSAARARYFAAFDASLSSADEGLEALQGRSFGADNDGAIDSIRENAGRYLAGMRDLARMTARNDMLFAEMDERLSSLIELTDEARRRQHDSNADVVRTLTDRDGALRSAQAIVDTASAARMAITDASRGPAGAGGGQSFANVRLTHATDDLGIALQTSGAGGDAEDFRTLAAGLLAGQPADKALDWLDRLLKIKSTEQRSLHDQVAELLTYTVQAHETEQATQNIAIATLKLGDRTLSAFSERDSKEVAEIIAESTRLSDTIGSLPISPLIQTEMLDALEMWRDGLAKIERGLSDQNAILGSMGDIAAIMLLEVASLNTTLSANAEEIGATVRQILLIGAVIGLVIGAATALFVARSISTPLKRLENGMLDRAAHGASGPLPDEDRRDEIGSMARATNHFLRELGKREGALRGAKERTEEALRQLKQTQWELIQAEKLASLGQLVAGVAHEINTPLGVALTTATVMSEEVRRFEAEARAGRVTRAAFDDFVERTGEGARLVFANLERSANLVQSFKQVAVDQASGERRSFELGEFTEELFVSLGPLIKRAGHRTEILCEPGITMDSYPGALAQVLTNLLSNAFAHAFEPGRQGLVRLEIARREAGLQLIFSDDGRGIAPHHRRRVFDPFFTTGRGNGSTGLGLHIVFNLVTATLGGTIAMDAPETIRFGRTPLPGARFAIDLPLAAPQHGALGEAGHS
ncbi:MULTISPECIES: sensor histidine kinase [unclassified Aureimonas]|uniref:sensor histidine kinase n=1 Tax=unclassified Aureimonas TaxID=2615206 RepID=UPI0006F29CBD|nr:MULTISPECIES: ATP-binding protein [unclassified Aureimonas]KQT55168.1 hypothetical protein ASG62_09965 [Aureimonas sp. Leaf427]KQT70957.1 hypothetical protein ASG54_20350 [Aureimonas sp. Leaf460]